MPHAYLGSDHRLYLDYADAATGRTLEVAPGGSYEMCPREPGMPVPPADGRWGEPVLPSVFPSVGAWLGVARELTEPEAVPEPGEPEPESTPETSALPALPGTGDGGQPATDIKE